MWMNRTNDNPIILIEDDVEDQELLQAVFAELGYVNELIFFDDGQAALDYLNNTTIVPFLILSDINMPKLDGFALRDKLKMDADLQLKCIPYIFFTTAQSQKAVVDAYSRSVQGFFVKGNSFEDLKAKISAIMIYWQFCVAPNHF